MNNRILVIFIFLFSTQVIFSQEYSPIDIPKYDFINLDTANLIIPVGGDSSVINNFFAKFEKLIRCKEGKINILHIGGSHIQAGIFSDQIRNHFIENNWASSRGYIFPYKVAKTNNPYSYDVKYDGEWSSERCVKRGEGLKLGMGGIAVSTKDPNAYIHIKLNDYVNKNNRCNRIKILGYVKDGAQWAVTPVIKAGILAQKVVFPNYDYIGKNHFTYELKGSFDEFKIYFQRLDPQPHEFVITGLLIENDNSGVIYHAIGVNGAAVHSYLDCDMFIPEMQLIAPDMVIFGIGINDAVPLDFDTEQFKANYNNLINNIRQTAPDCAFIFITNNDSYRRLRNRRRRYYYAVNKNGLKVQKAMYELAIENKGAVFDQFEFMGGLKSMAQWKSAGLAKRDKIHFTTKGYSLLGDIFFNSFMQYYFEVK